MHTCLSFLKMDPAKSFRDLVVWQKSHAFVLNIYKYTLQFPGEELFGLTSQLRRAAYSIPSNLAEGFKKRGSRDKAKFLNIAQASLEECKYFILLAFELGYLPAGNKLMESADEIGRMLESYYKAVTSTSKTNISRK